MLSLVSEVELSYEYVGLEVGQPQPSSAQPAAAQRSACGCSTQLPEGLSWLSMWGCPSGCQFAVVISFQGGRGEEVFATYGQLWQVKVGLGPVLHRL